MNPAEDTMPTYQTADVLSLKASPVYNERWLHQRIAENPAVLGLGDLVVKDVERRQPRAGRLDLLLSDPDSKTRYEVEIQLGATDETHIIRTIEYWDIERRRYPQYDHVAVIVAEDITSRFLNVLGLFNGFIPLVAIQLQALQVGDVITLAATKVMDVTSLGGADEEDEAARQSVDRAYWEGRATPATLAVADKLLDLIHAATGDTTIAWKYNRHYMGLARDGVPDNFATVRPRKQAVLVNIRIPRSDELTNRLEDSGLDVLDYETRWGHYRIRLTKADINNHRDLLEELMRRASGTPEPELPGADN